MSELTFESSKTECTEVLAKLAALPGLQELLAELRTVQNRTEIAGSWDTREGRRVESAMGNISQALEAAGVQL